MKTLLFFFFILINVQYADAQIQQNENTDTLNVTGSLTVIITGFVNNNGYARIGLYNSKGNYDSGKSYRGIKVSIENKQAIYTYDKIPYGEYAIKVYHDENLNDKMDRNYLGMPTEAYAFSNNVKSSFGPASYEETKFLFNKNKMTIKITF